MNRYLFTEKAVVGYGKREIVKDMTFSAQRGQILTIIGPNGAGKSTILKSVASQLELISGTIYLDEKNLQKLKRNEVAEKMAVVLTEKVKTQLTTCREIVEKGRFPYTGVIGRLKEKDREVVDRAMELVNVTAIADKDFSEISDGQRQRVLLACAIAQEPEIIILDEPTSFLDIRHKIEFLTLLRRLCSEQGLLVVMSMHEIELAKRASDLILCVKNGSIDKFGSPSEIFKDEYIAHLFDVNLDAIPGEYRDLDCFGGKDIG